jgi:UDP-N-acetylmuramoyl-tripeptide--D-alanyl-D-alanine ligase
MIQIERYITSVLIYQQEDYLIGRWWRWWWAHPFRVIQSPRKSLQTTWRIRGIHGIGLVVLAASLLLGVGLRNYWLLGVMLILGVFPGLLVGWAGIVLVPVDWFIRRQRERTIKQALSENRQITSIGITGSFGKSSVKEILFSILSGYHYTLMTPDTFNTLGGIFRVVKNELVASHRYFVCEMGAYGPGDIAYLAGVVKPNWGIITGVGPQHIERFGDIETIVKTKAEMIACLPHKRVVVNWDNAYLRDYIVKQNYQDRVWKVGFDRHGDFVIKDLKLRNSMSTYSLVWKSKSIQIQLPLFGSVQVINSALAVAMAWLNQIPIKSIQMAIHTLEPMPHRLELKPWYRGTLIDNTYSSNVEGFIQILADMTRLKGKKALVTPGVVELGRKEKALHRRLGSLAAGVFDTVLLVGKTERTNALQYGLRQGQFSGITDYIAVEEYWARIRALGATHDWILLENDLPDVYV